MLLYSILKPFYLATTGKIWFITGTIVLSALRDCSTYKFQCTSFLKFESHDKISFKYR
jgi:hypothetical protein